MLEHSGAPARCQEPISGLEGIMQTAMGLSRGDFVWTSGGCSQQCLATVKSFPSPQKVRPTPGKVELLADCWGLLSTTPTEWRLRVEVK